MSATVAIVIACTVLIILQPQILDPLYALVERMVLDKQSSSSFNERGMWRSTAIAALFDTHGLGVGLGGTRASSSVVAVFASTGILGGALLYAFVVQCLMRRGLGAPAETQVILSAFRFSFIAPFAVSLMVSDANFGGVTAFSFGVVTALAIAQQKQTMQNRHLRTGATHEMVLNGVP
jgi:hypothetical protein